MPYPSGRQTRRIGAGEITKRQPHVRSRRQQCPARGKTARRGDHIRTQRHDASLPRHSPGEINVFKQRHVLKTSDALEYRSPNENALVAVKPTETPRTPFAEQASQTQDPRTALEASREPAAHDRRFVERRLDLLQCVRPNPRIAMKKEEDVATRHSRSQVHLCGAPALATADELRPRRVGQ